MTYAGVGKGGQQVGKGWATTFGHREGVGNFWDNKENLYCPIAHPGPAGLLPEEKFSFQEVEMDWRECKVFWNPVTGLIRVAGQHEPHPSKSSYPMWLAGREAETAGLAWDDHRVVAKVFVEFSSIVVRDGISPRRAHEAFLMIRQYAEFIAPDA
jgi:hypothetical protein